MGWGGPPSPKASARQGGFPAAGGRGAAWHRRVFHFNERRPHGVIFTWFGGIASFILICFDRGWHGFTQIGEEESRRGAEAAEK